VYVVLKSILKRKLPYLIGGTITGIIMNKIISKTAKI